MSVRTDSNAYDTYVSTIMDHLHPTTLQRFLAILLRAQHILLYAKTFLWRITARDLYCVTIIVLLATLTRIPFLAQPSVTMFDETIYANNSIHLLHGTPYVDTHPPLARMLFTAVAHTQGEVRVQHIGMGVNQPFEDFPYQAVRMFVAVIGTLLPLAVYTCARAMDQIPRMAALPALFVVFDNALALYARAMLPDTLLLLFSILCVTACLMLVRSRTKQRTMLFVCLAGVTGGLALSVKWIALGVTGTVAVLLCMSGRVRQFILICMIAFTVYVVVFISYFMFVIPDGGKADNIGMEHVSGYVGNITFPDMHSLSDALTFLPSYHRIMMMTNNDPSYVVTLPRAPSPASWPNAQSTWLFWNANNGETRASERTIIMAGNATLWTMSFLVFLFNVVWNILYSLRKGRLAIGKSELMLMVGYLANFLPFFFIHRPMYVYHYFTALLFLYLLVPYALPRIRHCIELITHDKWFSYVFISFALLLVVFSFVYNIPITYGTHSWAYMFSQS